MKLSIVPFLLTCCHRCNITEEVRVNSFLYSTPHLHVPYVMEMYICYGIQMHMQNSESVTLERGMTRNAPPPPDSTITARNFGLTQQKVESQEDFDTRMLSKHCSRFKFDP